MTWKVLCKCSGKYIDIYFNLKITYFCTPRRDGRGKVYHCSNYFLDSSSNIFLFFYVKYKFHI